MALLSASKDARAHGTTKATQDERARSWRRWRKFLGEIQLPNDPFLSTINEPQHRNTIICAFAQAIREATYSPKHIQQLGEGSVRTAVDHVAQTFRSGHRPDPRLDAEGRMALPLSQQLKGYKNLDSNIKPQKVIPLSIINQRPWQRI